MEYDDYLAHYGVKGMKWGRQRAEKREAKRASRTPEEQARRDKFKSTAKKAAVGAVIIGGVAAAAYATRNTPQVQMGKFVLKSHKNVFKEDVARLAGNVKTKVGQAYLNRSSKGMSSRRVQKATTKLKDQNDWMNATNKYEAFVKLNTPKNPPKDRAVRKVMEKVDGGRSVKDAIFDESVKYGANLAKKYAVERGKQKLQSAKQKVNRAAKKVGF